MLEKVRKAGIPAPIVHHLDTESNKIYMEILPGPAVVNYLKEKGDTISDAECMIRLLLVENWMLVNDSSVVK
jgi:tRNA A-37 threonylcarbamoyl transferase component Bud32